MNRSADHTGKNTTIALLFAALHSHLEGPKEIHADVSESWRMEIESFFRQV